MIKFLAWETGWIMPEIKNTRQTDFEVSTGFQTDICGKLFEVWTGAQEKGGDWFQRFGDHQYRVRDGIEAVEAEKTRQSLRGEQGRGVEKL